MLLVEEWIDALPVAVKAPLMLAIVVGLVWAVVSGSRSHRQAVQQVTEALSLTRKPGGLEVHEGTYEGLRVTLDFPHTLGAQSRLARLQVMAPRAVMGLEIQARSDQTVESLDIGDPAFASAVVLAGDPAELHHLDDPATRAHVVAAVRAGWSLQHGMWSWRASLLKPADALRAVRIGLPAFHALSTAPTL